MALSLVAEQVTPAIHRLNVGERLVRVTQHIMRLEVAFCVEDWSEVVAVHEVVARSAHNRVCTFFSTKRGDTSISGNAVAVGTNYAVVAYRGGCCGCSSVGWADCSGVKV